MNQSKLECMKGIIRQRHFPTHKEFISCVEQMLVFHANVNNKKFLWLESCSRRFDESLRLLQKQMAFCFPRVEGDCHKCPKMHLIEHLSGSIVECGAPLNFDCMDGEKALQEFAKILSWTVKSVSDLACFNRLLSRRCEEHLVIEKMLKNMTYKKLHSSR